MQPINVIHVANFVAQERRNQKVATPLLVFLLRGFSHIHADGPNGRKVRWTNPGPRIYIDLPGSTVDFASGADRANWVVLLSGKNVRYNPTDAQVYLRYGSEWCPVPECVELTPSEAVHWRKRFERLQHAWQDGTPRHRLLAQLIIAEVFGFMIERRQASMPDGPAVHMKQLIDQDARHERSLDELSLACGYCPSRVRTLFRETYQLSPQEYRGQRRMALVMDLVANSTMSVKEIARATGFRHVSHISHAFHRAQGMTLSEAIRRNRR